MAKQTFTTGQVLTAAQMASLQQTAMGGGSTTAKTASYVLVAADAGTVVQMNAAGATTITVNSALFAAGDTVKIMNIGAGVCTVTAGTATVSTAGSLALPQFEGGDLYFNSASAALFFDIVQGAGMTNPLTTTGDTIFSSSGTTPARLGIGSTGQVLTVAGGVPSWATPAGASFVGCSIYGTADQAVANNTDYTVLFNSENYDTDGFHSTATNTGRITIPAGKGGKYLVEGRIYFAAGTSNNRSLKLQKNGATINYLAYIVTGGVIELAGACVVELAATDYLTFVAGQESGSTINIGASQTLLNATATFLGA